MHATVHLWRSEGNFWEMVLAFHHVGLRDQSQSQALKIGSKPLLSAIPLAPDGVFESNFTFLEYPKHPRVSSVSTLLTIIIRHNVWGSEHR